MSYNLDIFGKEELTRIAEISTKLMNEKLPGLNSFVLYGGLAREDTPSAWDIDLMIVSNHIKPQYTTKGSTKQSGTFFKEIIGLVNDDEFTKNLTNGLLDIHLLHPDFFSDLEYRINFFKQLNNQDPFFFYNSIMRDGLLYNPNTCKFDIKAREKYNQIIQKSIENRRRYNLNY